MYMQKPKTININGYEVPEPCKEPLEEGTRYFYVNTGALSCEGGGISTWLNDFADRLRLQTGIIHLTREATKLHLKALLSFTKQEEINE